MKTMLHGQTKMLMREQITERARHHRLNSTDRAVQHMNQSENKELNKLLQDMCKSQRKFMHNIDQTKKHFKRNRRKSLARVLILEGGVAKFTRKIRSKKRLPSIKDTTAESSDDLDEPDAPSELITIAEHHEKRRASFCPPEDLYGSIPDITRMQKLNDTYEHALLNADSIETIPRTVKLPPIQKNTSEDDKPQKKELPEELTPKVLPLPNIKVSEEVQIKTFGEPSTKIDHQVVEDMTLLNLDLTVGSDVLLAPSVAQLTRRGSTDSTIPYNLAYDDRELEVIEKEKKRNLLQLRKQRQSKKTNRVKDNVNTWCDNFDRQMKEQRRLENLYKDPEKEESADESDE